MGDKTKTVRTPAGRFVDAPEEALEAAGKAYGTREATPEEVAAERQRLADEEKYGGVLGGAAAAVENFASGATGGLYDVVGRTMFGEDFTDPRRKQREYHPVVSTLAEAGGAVVGPGKLGAAAGAKIAAEGGLAAKAAGLTAEGAIASAGTGVTETFLDKDPVTIERLLGNISSNAALGGAVNVGLGAVGKTFEKVLSKSKGALDDVAKAKPEATPDAEFVGKDRGALRAEREAEVAKIEAVRAEGKAKLADDILAMRQQSKDAKPWMATDSKELRKVSLGTERQVDKLTDNVKGLAQNPRRALDALQRQEQTLERILAESGDVRTTATAELAKEEAAAATRQAADSASDAALAAKLRESIDAGTGNVHMDADMAKRFDDFADYGISPGAGFQTSRQKASEFLEALESGKVPRKGGIRSDAQVDLLTKKGVIKVGAQARLDAIEKTEQLLAQNKALQQRLDELYQPAASERLARIDAAVDAMSGPRPKESFLEKAVSGSVFGAAVSALPAIPFGGVIAPAIGAKVAGTVTDLLFKRGGDAVAGTAARTAKAMDALMTGAKAAQKAAPPLSSAILSQVRFAEEEKRGPGRPKKQAAVEGPRDTSLAASYRARESELRKQVESGPDGMPRMTPSARQKLGTNLTGLKLADPVLADKVETAVARRVEFLASKLPKRPDFAALPLGPDTWRPSEMEMRRFARYVAAAEDPGSVEERLAAGTVSPEDAEAYQAVYPERLEALKLDLLSRLPQLKKSLGFNQKLSLSILTGVPLVPALQPAILRVLQANYTDEPGTEGGTVAPTAQPQFGSISKEKPTPSQGRAGG